MTEIVERSRSRIGLIALAIAVAVLLLPWLYGAYETFRLAYYGHFFDFSHCTRSVAGIALRYTVGIVFTLLPFVFFGVLLRRMIWVAIPLAIPCAFYLGLYAVKLTCGEFGDG